MQTRFANGFRVLRVLLLVGLLPAILPGCCPTGAFEDNFGRLYTLVTIPPADFDPTDPANTALQTRGTVDTLDLGCGVWQIQPESPLDPAVATIQWVAVNPNPDPADQCCYAFRFDGQVAPGGCNLILGEYRNVGGKCEGSGQMFLQVAQ